jgi:hypothetical protein
MLLGCRQDALQSNQKQIVDQEAPNLFWTAAHVFLLKSRDPLADSRFHLTLSHHDQHSVQSKLNAFEQTGESSTSCYVNRRWCHCVFSS